LGLTLSNALVRALTEDELKTAKSVLSARAASTGKTSAEKIDSQLMVAAGECVPALMAAIQVYQEVRSPKLEAVTRPFKEGMAVPPSPEPISEPFDVWSVPYERPAGSAQKDFILIPATLDKKDCTSCLGKASVPCKVCFAKGTVNCDGCMGAGSQACGVCKGQSKIACPDCAGSGKVKAGGNRAPEPCGSCGGVGKFNCNHCSGGKVDCAVCANSGKKACVNCAGVGKQNCGICGGSAKVVMGKGFQVEFRLQQAQSSILGAAGPQTASDMALTQKSPPIPFDFPSEAAFKKDLATADISEALRGGLEQLLARVRPPNAASRLGALRLTVAQSAVWRLTGAFSGHEFVYWIHPSSHTVIAEKDPLGDVSRKSAETALDALKRGDWEAAVDAARDTLSLDPHHAEARGISNRWRRRLLQESLLTGLGAGSAGTLVSCALIFGAGKGLYRMGPALLMGGLCLFIGLTTALALTPLSRRIFSTKRRLLTGGGGSLAAVLLFLMVSRGLADWNPVKSSDQKTLAGEMKEKFKYGVSAVYHEPDLQALQKLYDKYKDSQADLTELNQHILSQMELKTAHEALTREFLGKLDEVRYSNLFMNDKRARIADLKEHYALRNVDVSPAEALLKDMDEQISKASSPSSKSRPPGKISITSSRRTPAAVKKAPSKKAAKTAAKPRTPPRKVIAAKKTIKPNKVTAAKKKKKTLFGSKTVD
jgi:hypothetical protein